MAARPAGYEAAKVYVLNENGTETEEIEVLFNPTEYSLEKSVQYGEVSLPGLDTPVTQFVSGNAETLSMDLLLDTYDTGADVRDLVEKFDEFVTVDGARHAPPVCKFVWGKLSFTAVVERLGKRFTLFLPDGYPIRAQLSVSFKRYERPRHQTASEPRESADRTKVRTVTEGDSLWALAAAEYGTPGVWRVVAEANGIANPRLLEPGTELRFPPLDQ